MLGHDAGAQPFRRLSARLAQDGLSERDDEPGCLGDRNKPVGWHEPATRRAPAEQGLDADDVPLLEIHFRLVVQRELAALQAGAELLLEAEQLPKLPGHVVPEDLEAAAAGLFGRVHREVGVPNQLLAVAGTAGMESDAD